MPGDGTDGSMTVEVTGMPDEDGYLYLEKTVDNMVLDGNVTGENIRTDALEECSRESGSFFRIQAEDQEKEVTVKAEFAVPEFYALAEKAADNGGEREIFSYAFTNLLGVQIGEYEVKVYLPEGKEIMTVTDPGSYEDYTLEEEAGMRSIRVSGALKAAEKISLAFDCSEPFLAKAWGKAVVWVVCLGIGAAVFVDRFKKARKGN